MLTKVQKWGNSLALRIPKAFAVEAGLETNSLVEVSLVDDLIVIKPITTPGWTLDQLLSGVTPDNIHTEIETGEAIGNEIW